MSNEIEKQEPSSENMLTVIARAVSNPNLDVEKMKQLLDLHERIVHEQRRVAFDDAMARLQAKLPQIEKYGQGKNSKYAKYEDIDVICRPLWIEEGFSLSFSEKERKGKEITFQLEVSRSGYSKPFYLTLHTDEAAHNREGRSIRPPIQDDGSTATYAQRYLIKMALNIVEKDVDTDGEDRTPISDDEAKDLEAKIDEVKANRAKFLAYMNVDKIAAITKNDLQKALNALETKRQQQ